MAEPNKYAYQMRSRWVLTLDTFQGEQAEWVAKQPFAGGPSWHPLLGIVEEVGELAHAYLKQEQGIRGTVAEHTAAKRDAVGDTLVYLADYCTREGFSLQEILEQVWSEVRERNWTANPETGQAVEITLEPEPVAEIPDVTLADTVEPNDHDLYASVFDHIDPDSFTD